MKEFNDPNVQKKTLQLLTNLICKTPDRALVAEFCEPENILFLMWVVRLDNVQGTQIINYRNLMECDFEETSADKLQRNVKRCYFACTFLVSLLAFVSEYWKSESLKENVCERLLYWISQYPDLEQCVIDCNPLGDMYCKIIRSFFSNGTTIWCLYTLLHMLRQEKNETPEVW